MTSRMEILPEGISLADALERLYACGCTRRTEAYLMNLCADFDQKTLPLKDALQAIWYAGPAVIICSKERLAFVLMDSGGYGTIKAIMSS